MENIYRSPDEAYPFLADEPQDLRCDFELLTDELASLTGLLAAKTEEPALREELLWLDEMIYHANPTLRTRFTLKPEEVEALRERTELLMREAAGTVHRFVLPQGFCLLQRGVNRLLDAIINRQLFFNIIQYSLTSSKGVFSDLEEVPANQITLLKNANANIPAGTIIRLSIRGLLDGERLTVTDNTNPDVSYTKTGNGILEFTPENTLVYARMTVAGLKSKANRTISIEQLPLYPGALVNDGVDDYGKTVDIIDDEIGTVILHSIMLTYPDEPSMNSYFFDTGTADEKDIYAYCTGAKALIMGNPYKTVKGQIKVFARSPIAPTKQLYIASYMNLTGYSNSVISRLIFIKEQLDEAQLEFLTWKVGKEYRDWCKANGDEYAISEMLNN